VSDGARSSRRIAVIGMACRVPGAANVDQFWANLRDGVESIADLSEEDLAAARRDPAVEARDPYVARHSSIDGIEYFDADFFGISAAEARLIDPQHRVFLECAWHALEDAGYAPGGADLCCGVFAGAAQNMYADRVQGRRPHDVVDALQLQVACEKDHLATRVAYKLDLRGPAITIQTACSTGLVAVDLACLHLLTHRCDVAVAGAVAINVPPRAGYVYAEGGILSPDGHCRAFDAAAGGTVFGSGVGVVVLKRLSDAEASGDHIRAVILGSAVNNDGATKVGYTAPSVTGQAEVIALAQAVAGVSPDTIGYLEAHGTATALGDPIEVDALTQAFRVGTSRRGFCALGSVKSNVGHLEAAAGVTGLIKTVLSLEHEAMPATLHFTRVNPRIALAASPFYVAGTRQAWPRGTAVRRAGVSSFGIGGTNAHVVLEEAPAPAARREHSGPHLLVLSGRTPAARDALTAQLAAYLDAHPTLVLGDVAFTLQVGRRAFRHRRIVVAETTAGAAAALHAGRWIDGEADAAAAAPLPAAPPLTAPQLEAIGRRWLAGTPIEWASLHGDSPRRVPLPAYPFARVSHWIEPARAADEPRREPTVIARSNGVESRVIEIWRDVLGGDAIDASADFFALGGDSLIGTELVARLSNEFGIDLPLSQLADAPTVGRITRIITSMCGASAQATEMAR
jgi:acyl transferase domain-containing protein